MAILLFALMCMDVVIEGNTEPGMDLSRQIISDVIFREKLGIAFKAVGKLDNANSGWLHVYKVAHLNNLKIPEEFGVCDNLKLVLKQWNYLNDSNPVFYVNRDPEPMNRVNYLFKQCQNYQDMIPSIWTQMKILNADIGQNLEAIDTLLDRSKLISDTEMNSTQNFHSRGKRSPLDIISKIGHYLFGFATDADLNRFQSIIDIVHDQTNVNTDNIQILAETLQSYSHKINNRFQNLTQEINTLTGMYLQNKQDIQSVYFGLLQRILKIEKAYLLHGAMITKILKFGFQRLNLYQEYHNLVSERLAAIDKLVNHNLLSPMLIAPSEINELIIQINRLLRIRYPKFQVAVKDSSFVFRTPGVAYTWDKNYLYIQIRIPLTAYDSEYKVYEPIPMILPISGNHSDGYTKIQNLPELFAISITQNFYFTLTRTELDTCVGSFERYCLRSFPVTSRDIPSCVSSLYLNNYKDIRNTCTVKYMKTQIPIQLLQPIVANKYLSVTWDTDKWYLTCDKQGPKHIPPITFGLFELKCDCSLRTDKYFLPPSIDNCNLKTNSEIEHSQINNLVYLLKWLDEEQLSILEKDLNNMYNFKVEYPQINNPDYNSHYLPVKGDMTLDLEDVIIQTKTSKKLHHDAVSDIFQQLKVSHKKSFSITIIVIITLIAMALILVAIVVLGKKFNIIKGTLLPLIASHIPVADAAIHMSESCPCPCISLPNDLLAYVLILTSIIGSIYALVKLMYKIYIRLYYWMINTKYYIGPCVYSTLEILLEMSLNEKVIYLPLARTKLNPGNFLLMSPEISIDWVENSSCYRPKIQVDWTTTVLTQRPVYKQIYLPKTVSVPILAQNMVHYLLHNDMTEYSLLAGVQGRYTYIPIVDPDIEAPDYNFYSLPRSEFVFGRNEDE